MIEHNKPTIEEDDVKSVRDVLSLKWISPGEKVREFERELAKYLSGDGHAVTVDSGSSALYLALLALGAKKGDEVILPTYVYSAVLNAVNYTSATPVLVDINLRDLLYPSLIAEEIDKIKKALDKIYD
jgi:perosamine synthetase